jgi:hypothetical protein
MTSMSIPPELAGQAVADLSVAEEVGFFLGEYDTVSGNFDLRQWRFVEEHEVESRSGQHVVLTDDMRGELIRWAWNSGGVLVEAHSHGPDGVARFSGSDLVGFQEWVPHLSWRLQRRPYAAVVVAGDQVDAIAWVDDPKSPVPIEHIDVIGEREIVPTGLTMTWLTRRSGHGI